MGADALGGVDRAVQSDGLRPGGHHVDRVAAFCGAQSRARQRQRQRIVQYPLLAADDGKVGVGREAGDRQLLMRAVIRHVLPVAALLALPEDEPHAAAQRRLGVLQVLHREERRQNGALVVHRAAAVEPVAAELAPRIVRPALAVRHHVEMPQHGGQLVARADLRPGDPAAAIFRADAQRAAEREHIVQRFGRAAAVGRRLARIQPRHAVDGQQAEQRVQKLFLIHRRYSPSFLFAVFYITFSLFAIGAKLCYAVFQENNEEERAYEKNCHAVCRGL